MLLAFIRFYCTNIMRFFLPPGREIADSSELDSHTRRYTYHYQQKKVWVKNLWILSSALMLCFPILPFVLSLTFFTTFLSFAILDETA
ncbi:hypothetical protein MO867_08310 [Microbulbifer sp. OS29]|uniref:Uncharacterized protein n=1 Tax=Microbulbifer okhotskensis TaxID=2926617 RepID=A0A9X2ERF7_9GAMM|nr:hypothetical protein [Microbulbifer okhotskensis]MCO1334341.1 hypothetical protein [Microbulbifer okhotskensis]